MTPQGRVYEGYPEFIPPAKGAVRTSWEHEFRSRVTYTIAPDHYRHGLIGTVTVAGEDGGSDPTYGDTYPGNIAITLTGYCPCGELVSRDVSGMYDTAELITFITRPEMNEQMARATVDPFQEGS